MTSVNVRAKPPLRLRKIHIKFVDIATYFTLGLAGLFVVLPILWALSTSLKLPNDIHAWPPRWVPLRFTFDNYIVGFLTPRFLHYLMNNLIVVAGSLVVSIALGSHAAYAVARKPFFGKNILLLIIWATIMIPGVSIIVPLYLLAVDIGIYDTYTVLIIVYSAWLIPSLIWLLRGFIDSIPLELEEAAQMDGCGPLKTFYVIVLPLMRPGIAAAAVLVFVTIWNDFLIGYALVVSDERRLLQVGLQAFMTEGSIEWGPMMAATLGSLIPAAILFGVLQRAFIQGVTGGAVKG
jgi:ABC-type glycerol-3-phosphate transport system permease component